MRQIFEIARKEIRSLFYSPIGWLTLIILLVHTAFIIIGQIDHSISLLLKKDMGERWFTQAYFSRQGGVFTSVSQYYFLYIPFLTMGLISREYSEGGIKLIFSSPIKTWEFLLGKYMAMMGFGLLMVGVYGIIALFVRIFVLDSIDVPLLLSGLLVMYLLICMYAAIGLFVSSLTSYQLVAAVGTFATLFVFNSYLTGLIQSQHPEFLQLIVSVWLPPNLHTNGISGLLNGSDLIYFILMICMFLTFTWLRLKFMKETKSLLAKASIYAGVVVAILFCGWVTSKPEFFFYYDLTAKNAHSPSPEQKEEMNKLTAPLSFTRYLNVLENPQYGSLPGQEGTVQAMTSMRTQWKIKPDISYIPFYAPTEALSMSLFRDDSLNSDALKVVTKTTNRLNRSTDDFDLEELRRLAADKFAWLNSESILSPEQVGNKLDLSNPRYRNGYLIKSGQHTTFFQKRGFSTPTDQELTTTLKSMVDGKVVIGFLRGHGERNPFSQEDHDYSNLFTNYFFSSFSLINLGFDVVEVSLDSLDIPEKISILVIADPVELIKEDEYRKIENYIAGGGNMFITVSPKNHVIVNKITTRLGVNISDKPTHEKYAKIVTSAIRGGSSSNDGFLPKKIMPYSSWSLIDKKGIGAFVSMPNAVSLQRSPLNHEYAFHPVIVSLKDTVMYAVTRSVSGKQQRILVAGGADFLSNSVEGVGYESAFGTSASNLSVNVSLFKWLSNDKYPTEVKREQQLERLVIRESGFLKILMVAILPLPLLIGGIIILSRRKRK